MAEPTDREPERMFPILRGDSIPWALIESHRKQADINHGQTLERLAERGGLSEAEAIAVIEDRRWRAIPIADARIRLAQLVRAAAAIGEVRT